MNWNRARLNGTETGTTALDGGQVHRLIGLLPTILTVVEEIRSHLDGRRKDFYTVEEVAELTGRKPYTVRSWIKDGKIEATRIEGTGPKGRLLVSRAQLQSLIGSGLGGQLRPELVD